MRKTPFCILSAGLLLIGFFVFFPSTSHAATLLFDDFSASSVSSSNWHIPTWVSPIDGTYVGRTQFMCSQNASLPTASNSNAIIKVQSYNPTGFSFYGTDLISNKSFALGQGIDISVRAKMNNSAPGIVGGIFLYDLEPGSNTLHNEIDFEMLTNLPNQIQTNVYSNEPLGAGSPQLFSYASGSINDYHTYEIQWLPTQVSWLVDGKLIRTETNDVPSGSMHFHLNMWVPDSSWPNAYSASIQPTSSASSNQIFSMYVDSVNIQSLPIGYSYAKVNVGNTVEYRFYSGNQQFMTEVLDSNGAIAIRPHPGLDVNGWGSSLYLQPFLPGAVLRGTNIRSINLTSNGINVLAYGVVPKTSSTIFGTWDSNITFSYNPSQKEIIGSGGYNIRLEGMLNSNTGDLNLYKLASNYLINVPLLNGTTGNTGDMSSVTVSGGTAANSTWDPTQGSTYPQDYRNPISVALLGNYNQVNTAAQGYAPIAAAYKPSITVVLSPVQITPLIFGAAYDASKSQQYWQDNVGITPLILKNSNSRIYQFKITFDSTAIPGDH